MSFIRVKGILSWSICQIVIIPELKYLSIFIAKAAISHYLKHGLYLLYLLGVVVLKGFIFVQKYNLRAN